LNKYSGTVAEICENGDAIIQFSDEMIQDLGWKVDDVLSISMVDGAVHLKNITQHSKSIRD
jgi:hypothetical protein